MNQGGKGDRPRPFSVDAKTFESNWDAIFGKKKKTEAEEFDEKVIMKDEYFEFDSDIKDSNQGG